MVVELGVGSAHKALSVTFDHAGFITSAHAPNNEGTPPSMVFDVAWWKYEEGNDVNLVGESRHNHRSRDAGGGRNFVVNADGSISPARATHLTLGLAFPDCTLVPVTSANKLILSTANELRTGQSVPLLLASHPGAAIVPKTMNPRRIDELFGVKLGVSYQHWGVADAAMATYARLEGQFVLSTHPSSPEFVLDVPFDKREAGCDGMPLAVIHLDHGQDKEHGNKARQFVVNAEGSISPAASPHLVLGLREGAALMPFASQGAATAVPVMATAVPVMAAVEAVPMGL